MKKVAIIHGAYLHRRHTDHLKALGQWYELVGVASRARVLESTDIGFEVRQLPAVSDVVRKIPKLRHHIGWGSDQYLFGFDSSLADIDVLYPSSSACLFSWQAARLKRKTGARLVIHEVENIPFLYQDRWIAKYRREALEAADAIVAATERIRSALVVEGVPGHKITCIPFGADTKLFGPEKRDRSILRLLGASSEEMVILFSGRTIWGKGIFDIVCAAKRIMDDPDLAAIPVKFVLMGNGSGEALLRERITQMGLGERVTMVNSVPYDSVPAIYASVDIILAPSIPTMHWQEQFPLVITECLSSGTALITSQTCGPTDVAGDAAVFVNPADHFSLYLAIKDLLLDDKKRRELGNKARARALAVLDQDIVARQTAQVFESIG